MTSGSATSAARARKVRYYTDEHIARAVVRGLRTRGVDVQTVADADKLGAADEQHLEHARVEGRVIVTHDTDFLRLHAQGRPHAGIVYAVLGTKVGAMVRGLMLVHDLLDAEEMKNHLEFL